jgi:rod shape determining protein RodA
MLFLAGISWKWIGGALGTAAVLSAAFLFLVFQPEQKILNDLAEKNIIQSYWINRIDAFFFPDQYPNTTYQQTNSVLAIGGGQLTGKGLNTSSLESVKNGGFLIEEQNDFIFAVLGEELGFAGCMFLIVLYILITIEGLRISARSPDLEGKIIAGGLVAIFSFQAFVNMGVATMVLPNTGTPLPFISAGMSSLLGSYTIMGILLNIGLQKKRTIMEV